MNRLELCQAAGSVVGGTAGVVGTSRFGPVAAVAGIFIGAVLGIFLATGLYVLIERLRR